MEPVKAPYYQDEFVTLYHGDCLADHREWLDADVLVTDPPYGISWSQREFGTDKQAKNVIANDGDTSFRDGVLTSWGNRPFIAFGTWKVPRPVRTKTRLIWHKTGSNPGPLNAAFMSNDEEIYVSDGAFRKSSPPLRSVITTHESRATEVVRIGHPTPKPVGLMELLIDRCPPGVIADPFAGSGATLIAAKNLGRKIIGVELEERYCEIIAKRCAQGVLDIFGAA